MIRVSVNRVLLIEALRAWSGAWHPREIGFEQRGDMRCVGETADHVFGHAPSNRSVRHQCSRRAGGAGAVLGGGRVGLVSRHMACHVLGCHPAVAPVLLMSPAAIECSRSSRLTDGLRLLTAPAAGPRARGRSWV